MPLGILILLYESSFELSCCSVSLKCRAGLFSLGFGCFSGGCFSGSLGRGIE